MNATAVIETVIAGFALAGSGLGLAALLDIRGATARLLTVMVLCAGVVVGLVEVLSLLRAFTPLWVTVAQLLVFALVAVAWSVRGRPRLFPGRGTRRAIRLLTTRHRLLALLLAGVTVALVLQAFMAIAVAPNESDAIGYHLPRAAYWLQHHSALQYHPGQLDDPQLVAPPNFEMLVAWTMALSRTDALSQLVQWAALIATMAAIYGLGRLADFDRPACAWAAGIFGLMPAPLLQSATDQNDLVLTALLLACGLFLVRGVRGRHRGELLVSAVALGLALGTKLSVALAAPALALLTVMLLRRHRPPRRLIGQSVVLFVGAAVAFGAFNYAQNLVYTHTVTGFSGTPAGDFVKSDFLTDSGRVGWNLLDTPGLPVPGWLERSAGSVARSLFTGIRDASFGRPNPAIRTESNEDESAYGIVGLLVLVPLVLYSAFSPRTRYGRRLLALAALSFFAMDVLTLGYTPEGARYLMPAIAVAAPLLALTARPAVIAGAVLVTTLLTVPGTLLHDNNKLLIASSPDVPILSLDRLGQQTVDQDLAPFAPVVRRVHRLAGPHGAVGFLNQDDLRDYLLIGEPLQRRAVGFDPPGLTPAGIHLARVRGVVIGYLDRAPCVTATCVPLARGLRAQRIGPHSLWITAQAR